MTTSAATQNRNLIFGLVLAILALSSLACASARDVDNDVDNDTEGRSTADDPLLDEEPSPVADDDPPPPPTRVTVTGTVNEVADQNAFEIVESGGDRQFLVLVANPDVALDDVVRVTGSVREGDFDALAAELNFEIDEDLYSPADQQQVIIADSVDVVR